MKKIAILLAAGLTASVNLCGSDLVRYSLEDGRTPIPNQGNAASANAEGYLLNSDNITQGVVGNALRLFGMSDGLILDNPAASLPDNCTIAFYFRPERLAERMTLVSFYIADEQLIALKIQNGRLAALDWSNSKDRKTFPCGPQLELNRWYQLTWSMNGDQWRIYLDGTLVLNEKITAAPKQFPVKKLLIGNDYHSAVHQRDRLVGSLDEFTISDQPPTPETLTAAVGRLQSAGAFQPPASAAARAIQAGELGIAARLDNDTLSFVFNGAREPAMLYLGGGFLPSAGYAFSTQRDAAQSGMNVFRTSAEGGRDFCGGNWWYGPDQYDFSIVDRNLDFVFRNNPNAKILLVLPASPPAWWGIQNPDELCQDATGKWKQDYFASHSYSSKKWLVDLEKAWTAFFNHVKAQTYYKRIIGFVPVSGRYGECLRAGYNSQLYGKQITDYSPAEVAAYQAWLQAQYGTIEIMRKAYRNGQVPAAFAQVRPSSPADRQRPDGSYFADPVVDRANIDYWTFVNAQSAQAVCDFTAILRKLAGPDKLIGLYYGYVLEDALGGGRAWAGDSGHFGLGKVLREAPVDFLSGPVGYHQRELGKIGPCMTASASVNLHKKFWIEEADIRTSLNGHPAEYSGARDLDESLAVLWRTFGNTLVNRTGLWWFPIAGGKSYSDPAIWRDFGKMYQQMRIHGENPADDRTRRIALIVDTRSINFRRHSFNDQLLGNLLTLSRDVFAKAGIGSDYYISDDLAEIPDDYPIYIFLNSFYLDDAQRAIIARRFKKDGKLLVWTYGAGYFRNRTYADRFSVHPGNMADLIGMGMDWHLEPTSLNSTPVAGAPSAIGGLKIAGKYKPAFFVNDPAARPLAVFADGPGIKGKVAAAYKDMGTWRSVYVGTPEFTETMVRALARLGGAHIWTDAKNVVVRPGNGHLLIHSGHADTVKLTLPAPVKNVIDVATGNVIARNTATVELPIGKNRSVLLRMD